jgi:hypothetical protein
MHGEGSLDGDVWDLVLGGGQVGDGLVDVMPSPRLHHVSAWCWVGSRAAACGVEWEAVANPEIPHDLGCRHANNGFDEPGLSRGGVGLANNAQMGSGMYTASGRD